MDELKKALKEKNLVFGTKATLRNLRQGKAKKIIIASNCPKEIREEIKHNAKLSKAEVAELELPDSEIGMICKKRFSVSVLSY
ncbi:MAG: ribosomal L7Ae/L30e/S12e/Gadd45 family protein [archaeon]